MPYVRKTPMRQCVGCRLMKPKVELVRVVRSPEGAISLDPKGKKPGRGAYICRDPACLSLARKKRGLERVLGNPIPEDVFGDLSAQMTQMAQMTRMAPVAPVSADG